MIYWYNNICFYKAKIDIINEINKNMIEKYKYYTILKIYIPIYSKK